MRQRVHKEPLEGKKVMIYPSEWAELKEILEAEGSNLSYWVRNKVQLKIKSSRRK